MKPSIEPQDAAPPSFAMPNTGECWRRLYLCCRGTGKRHHDAEDLVQGFLAREENALDCFARAAESEAHFWNLLFRSISRFMIDENRASASQRRGGSLSHVNVAEIGDIPDGSAEMPWVVIERTERGRELDRGLATLQNAAARRGRGPLFQCFREHLLNPRPSYAELSLTTDLSEANLRVVFHRWRRALADLVRAAAA